MANLKRSFPENVAGNFFVDDTCIDCDLCRQIAPAVFRDEGDHSAVYRQPETLEEVRRSAMAIVACPTGSIGTRDKIDLQPAIDGFPEHIDDDVFFCGFASPNSYGAASYLIQREGGNVLVDSPRFAKHLVQKLEAMGGVTTMFLTHRDDIADHQKFADHFGCRRIIHKDDARGVAAERILEGRDRVSLDDELLVIPTPGHTRGHAVLLYRNKFFFTGDHLAWSDNHDRLTAFRSVTWYSWPSQTESMKRLLDLSFEWVLPGHGRRCHFSAQSMRQELQRCIDWMSTIS